MNFFLFIFLALLAFVTIGLLVVFYYVRKGVHYFRRFSTGEMSGEEFERMANKYYRKQNPGNEQFDNEYFKGSGWQNGQSNAQSETQQENRRSQTQQGGVIIEDRRAPGKAQKKIFPSDEGEYVEFSES